MPIPPGVLTELAWWHDSISHVHRPISPTKPDCTIFPYANSQGWGCYIPDSKDPFGGRWAPEDWAHDINYLEIKAILLSLQSCAKELKHAHIQIRSDNTTAVVAINRQGSTNSPRCNSITQQIWLWAIDRQLWLLAGHWGCSTHMLIRSLAYSMTTLNGW